MWTQARLATYLTSAAVGIGIILSMLGAADFDKATGMIDLHPVNLYALAAMAAGPLSALLASVAVLFGWGRK